MAENMQTIIDEHIQKCKVVIDEANNKKAKVVWYEVSGIFGAQIPGYYDFLIGRVDEEECLEDIPRIIGKLRTYSAKLHHEETIARCSQPITMMSQTTTVDINATFTQTATFVLDNEAFSPEETSEILVKIKTLKSLVLCGEDKSSKWGKLKPILEWTIERGVEIAPVIIPLIASALK